MPWQTEKGVLTARHSILAQTMDRRFMQFGELLEAWSLVRREFAWVRVGVYSVLCLALVLLAPFGTGSEPWPWRLTYWFVMIGLLDLVLLPLASKAVLQTAWLQRAPYGLGLALLPWLLAIPMTILVIAFDVLFERVICSIPPSVAGPYYSDLANACLTPSGGHIIQLYGYVLAISVLAGGLIFLGTGGLTALGAQTKAAVRPGLRFFSRLPAHLGTDIRYFQTEDHYLRVVTAKGEAMILMSMRDAIAELEGVNGLQVHRSWWLALEHVAQIARDGRKTVAVMVDGIRVPVSDTHRTALKEMSETE